MVATRAQHPGATGADDGDAPFHQLQRLHHIYRVGLRIAEVGHATELVGLDQAHRMHAAHEGRGVAQRTRAVARAGAVGDRAVEGDAEDRDVDALGRFADR